MFDIYGGLIFVGTIVSLVLIIGTFTMMYYKNIAEGYEDRKNYRIMRQVGLEEERIKSVINDQVIIIFTLPIIVSMIHVLFASKMIYTLLGILDVNNIKLFFNNLYRCLSDCNDNLCVDVCDYVSCILSSYSSLIY